MKNLLILLITTTALIGCKNDTKKQAEAASDDWIEISAEYYYESDGAVLMGKNFIYGVTLDAKAKELADKTAAVKTDPTDMVGVVVRGVLNNNSESEEGWQEVFTIVEIVAVSDRSSQPDIRLEN